MKRLPLSVSLLIPLAFLPSSGVFGDVQVQIGVGLPVGVYHYWYYPDSGIYYDYNAHVYFYLDGGVWHRVGHLPRRFHGLGHHVMVDSERGRPWARYDDHRAKYPAGQWRREDRDRHHDEGREGHHHDDDRH